MFLGGDVTVLNSSFEHNAGGFRRRGAGLEEDDHVTEGGGAESDEMKIEAECCKGTMLIVGKGGAIRVQRGNMTIEGCRFVNNTARKLGGAVYVDENRFNFL